MEASFTCSLAVCSRWHNTGHAQSKVTGWLRLFVWHLCTCVLKQALSRSQRHVWSKTGKTAFYITGERIVWWRHIFRANFWVITLCHKLLTHFTLITTLWYCFPRYTDEENEAWRSSVTCPELLGGGVAIQTQNSPTAEARRLGNKAFHKEGKVGPRSQMLGRFTWTRSCVNSDLWCRKKKI